MTRSFLYVILGAVFSSFLGSVSPSFGAGALPPLAPNIAKKEDVRERPRVNSPQKGVPPTPVISKASNGKGKQNLKPKGKAKATATGPKNPATTPDLVKKEVIANPADPVPPLKLRDLKKKTIILDARRLKEHKFTETIRYIKEHPNIRLKLQNMSINPDSAVSLMKGFQEAKVIDQIREISFVMLPGANNQVLNEKDFISKVLPYLGHLEGIDLSCLGVTDIVVEALPKKLPHLRNLSLFGVGITDKTISFLAKELPELRKIHLINTSLTNKGMQELAKNFPYLRALGISGQHLKDNDFNALRDGLEKLHSFSAVGQTFKDMKTAKNLLSAMHKLHTLDLSETNVTDDVAKSLGTSVPGLKTLDISETAITRSGLRAIVETLDLTTLKINHLKSIGKPELLLVADKQRGLRKFYFSGAYFDDPTIMNLILKLPRIMDLTLIPNSESTWVMSDSVAEALHLKETKVQYLHIPAKRLPELLRINLERNIPNIRIEYEG